MHLPDSMRRRELAVALLLAPAFVRAQPEAPNRPIDWARLLLRQVSPDATSYVHGPDHVRWSSDPAQAQSHTDCSGLVNAMLSQANGWTPQDLQRHVGRRRPGASTYFDAIQARRGFERVDRVQDIREGDFIAVRYEDGSADSGHIMIVESPPLHAHSQSMPGLTAWDVRVIDSSRSGHGPDDTRAIGPRRFREGLGMGDLRLYAAGDGTPAGYCWSPLPRSAFFPVAERPIAIGRLRVS
jgi:hypothetical protein